MILCACRLVWCSVGGFLKTFPPPVRVLDEFVYDAVYTAVNRFTRLAHRSPTATPVPHIIQSVLGAAANCAFLSHTINRLLINYNYWYINIWLVYLPILCRYIPIQQIYYEPYVPIYCIQLAVHHSYIGIIRTRSLYVIIYCVNIYYLCIN